MACLYVPPTPSATDQLNQLGDLSSFFSSIASGVSSVSNALASNSGAIVNVLDAYGKMQTQKAAATVAIKAADANARAIPQAVSTMTPAQLQAFQTAGGYPPTNLNFNVPPKPTDPNALPSWVLPAGLGLGALLLVVLLMPRRGAANG